uniref:Uncharacterized protein n=1 Tax=Meloidogyne enterolobii TaxID=390850 RepID=A0A6V7W912_MELEN|nr:unnamed protein product [Meloidogyne enterolobii]
MTNDTDGKLDDQIHVFKPSLADNSSLLLNSISTLPTQCDCLNYNKCDSRDGKCLCYGYTGRICQFPCPGENYGLDCSDTCTCQSEATCDRYNGSRRSTLKGNNYLYIV